MIRYRIYEFFLTTQPRIIDTDFRHMRELFEDRSMLFGSQRKGEPADQRILAVVSVGLDDHPRGLRQIYKIESDCGLDWLAGKLKEITL